MAVYTRHCFSLMSPCTKAVSELTAKGRMRLLGWLRILFIFLFLRLLWLFLFHGLVRNKFYGFTGLINMAFVILKEWVMFQSKMKLLLMF